jgi:hypothetical protein
MSREEGVNMGESKIVASRPMALLIRIREQGTHWILKSVIHDDSEVYSMANAKGNLILVRSFVEKRGWI